jgi:DNA-binding winged helix-turn-helix (wHTH) protein
MMYCAGPLLVDDDGFELRRDGQLLAVEPLVFDFILYLIRNRERVVLKNELLDALWKGSCVVEAVLTRCACLARKSVGMAAIRTVRGRGYRWVLATHTLESAALLSGSPVRIAHGDIAIT